MTDQVQLSEHDSDDDEVTRYRNLECWCKQSCYENNEFLFDPHKYEIALEDASTKYGYNYQAVDSFFRNIHLNVVVKSASSVIRRNMEYQLKHYQEGQTTILELATKLRFPPYLLCRYIVEAIVDSSKLPPVGNKNRITNALRNYQTILNNPNILKEEYLISEQHWPLSFQEKQREEKHQPVGTKTTRLVQEVQQCIDMDPLYGPQNDVIRHSIGIQYEMILEESLKELSIPFQTESQLRVLGSSRTPDILLQVPIAIKVYRNKKEKKKKNDDQIDVNSTTAKPESSSKEGIEEVHSTNGDEDDEDFEWKVICWIDSKAMFGDVETHRYSNLPQAESYVHRFGPGMILYWFGHAPIELLQGGSSDSRIKKNGVGGGFVSSKNASGSSSNDDICISHKLPDSFMWPTGEMGGKS